jgi:hypothetical protein
VALDEFYVLSLCCRIRAFFFSFSFFFFPPFNLRNSYLLICAELRVKEIVCCTARLRMRRSHAQLSCQQNELIGSAWVRSFFATSICKGCCCHHHVFNVQTYLLCHPRICALTATFCQTLICHHGGMWREVLHPIIQLKVGFWV